MALLRAFRRWLRFGGGVRRCVGAEVATAEIRSGGLACADMTIGQHLEVLGDLGRSAAVDDIARLTSLLSLMAEPVRVRILYALDVSEELSVGDDVALALDVNEDRGSDALRLLRSAGSSKPASNAGSCSTGSRPTSPNRCAKTACTSS